VTFRHTSLYLSFLMSQRHTLRLYRNLIKTAKFYGDVLSKRQLGEHKEISNLCSRVGVGSGILERLESKGATASLQEELRKQFQVQVSEVVALDLSKGFLALRAMNERLNFLSILPASSFSSNTTRYANVRIESFYIPVTAKRRGQSLGKSDRAHTFAYKVIISHAGPQNSSPFVVKSRRWVLTNENDDVNIAEGDGVVGKHPRLCAGEEFSYISFCTLATPLGVLRGHFDLLDENTGALIKAEISPIKLDNQRIPTREQAEDLEATVQAHAVPIQYQSKTQPEKVRVE